MSLDKAKLDEKITSKLCNVLVNCQELVDDLEDLEQAGLFRQNLKQTAKGFLKLTMNQVDKIFGVGHRKVVDAIKQKKSDEEVDQIRREAEVSNLNMVHVYETAIKSRVDYDILSFGDRLMVHRIIEDIRKGNVKYVGSELYYLIKSADELGDESNDSSKN